MADAKEIWSPDDLANVANFTAAFQEFLQEWDSTVPIKDAMLTLGDTQGDIGLVSMLDRRQQTVQFEPGSYDIGML